jgi:hypothetical protein
MDRNDWCEINPHFNFAYIYKHLHHCQQPNSLVSLHTFLFFFNEERTKIQIDPFSTVIVTIKLF